jgi:DNA-binding response OmpR family regulator
MDGRTYVLIVDDDPAAGRLVAKVLANAGFETSAVTSGQAAIDRTWELNPDLLLVDVRMPTMTGLDVLRELRPRHQVPVILMSGHDAVADVKVGLDLGADDFVSKPFNGTELAARIRAVLRRRRHVIGGHGRVKDIDTALAERLEALTGGEVALPRRERRLLECLIAADGGVVTHDELLEAGFGPAFRGDAPYLRAWIGQLRRRLGIPPWEEGVIRTVPGIGYMLDPRDRVPRRRVRRPKTPRSRSAVS